MVIINEEDDNGGDDNDDDDYVDGNDIDTDKTFCIVVQKRNSQALATAAKECIVCMIFSFIYWIIIVCVYKYNT